MVYQVLLLKMNLKKTEKKNYKEGSETGIKPPRTKKSPKSMKVMVKSTRGLGFNAFFPVFSDLL